MSKIDQPLATRIGHILATPVIYKDFPSPVFYTSEYGHKRMRCPVMGCTYTGTTGFNQHYARKHAPDQWGQHNKAIIKAVRDRKS